MFYMCGFVLLSRSLLGVSHLFYEKCMMTSSHDSVTDLLSSSKILKVVSRMSPYKAETLCEMKGSFQFCIRSSCALCLFIKVVLNCEFAIGTFLLSLNNKIYGIRNIYGLTGYDL